MKFGDFVIGEMFWTQHGAFRCTDIGARVVVAVKLGPREVSSAESVDGELRISKRIDEDPSWLDGPPYAVQEVVFDESDLAGCFCSNTELENGYTGNMPDEEVAEQTKDMSLKDRVKENVIRYVCEDCQERPPRGDYMVHDTVWANAGMQRRGFLCLNCLEARLLTAGHGRLKLDDFTSAPCNASLRFGYAVARREGEGL